MARTLDVLNRLRINNPCTARWDDMQGNDEVRFCGHCAKNVHNLSAMTRVDALRLVEESRGGLCIRYETTAAGSVFTRDNHVFSFPKLRLSPLVAAAFGIAITVTPAFAQENAGPACPKPEVVTTRTRTTGATGTVRGRLVNQTADPAYNVLGVQLSQNSSKRETRTNELGEFIFDNVPPGIYTLVAGLSVEFKPLILINIEVGHAEVVNIEAKWPRNEDFEENIGAIVTVPEIEIQSESDIQKPLHRKNTFSNGEFFNAAAEGDLGKLRKLFKKLKSADVLSPEKETPLVYAVRARKIEAVRFLLENGADANARSVTGRTTLMLAAMNGDAEIIRLLLKHGADRKLTDNDGRTAVTYTMKKEIADLLDTSNTK